MKNYALITGASSGIGKAIAIDLATRGHNLILVARSEEKLSHLAIELEKVHHVNALYLSLDLSETSSPHQLFKWCVAKELNINVLINNAGYAVWGWFEEKSLGSLTAMMQVNVNAVLAVTHHMIPILSKNKISWIMNVGATAGYQSIPTLSAYTASKSYVRLLSRGLASELKPLGISVSCLVPGPTATNFIQRSQMQSLQKIASKFEMQPEKVAKKAINGMFKEKKEIVPGRLNKAHKLLINILPEFILEKISGSLYLKKIPARKA